MTIFQLYSLFGDTSANHLQQSSLPYNQLISVDEFLKFMKFKIVEKILFFCISAPLIFHIPQSSTILDKITKCQAIVTINFCIVNLQNKALFVLLVVQFKYLVQKGVQNLKHCR